MSNVVPTPEEIERAKSMSVDELLKFAADEGIDISDEEMDQIAGGGLGWSRDETCSKGGTHTWKDLGGVICNGGHVRNVIECKKCGVQWYGTLY